MRFVHIADVHLGARPDAGPLYSAARPGELWRTFELVTEVCEKEKIDLLLIAGDLFHRQPLLRELKEADALFAGLTHTKVVLIAGNHDYIKMDSHYHTFRWSQNVFPLFGRSLEYVDFPELGTAVYGLSYYSREIREPLYDGVSAGRTEPVEILLAHGGDEKHIPVNRELLAASGFSYIAMGHIHKPQALAKDRIIYSGALEPVDKNDTGPHGYIRGEIIGNRVKIQWIPCACREYIHKEINVDTSDTTVSVGRKIDQFINDFGNQNIYKVILSGKRDPDILFDIQRLAGRGNILEVIDRTAPAYDFDRLLEENEGNVLGRFINRLGEYAADSIEYEALCEGTDALLGSRKERN